MAWGRIANLNLALMDIQANSHYIHISISEFSHISKIVQNINRHAIAGTHDITCKNRTHPHVVKLEHEQVSSTHHQMMYPWSMNFEDYEILAYAKAISPFYQGVPECENTEHYLDDSVSPADIMEPEVVWYHNSASLCCQFHPEIMDEKSGGFQYYQRLLSDYIFNT